MSRSIVGNIRISDWITRLVLACFAIRALIPAGYMPDVQLLAKGSLKIVICSVSGIKAISLDAQGKPAPSHKQTHHDQACAFSGLAAVTAASSDAAAPPPPEFSRSGPIALAQEVLPPVRAGPILGSRGPPQIS
jgi:hypothetical protein